MPPQTHRHTSPGLSLPAAALPSGRWSARRGRPQRESGSPTLGGSALRCTTQRHKTHVSSLELCYPWHPWYGKPVLVLAAIERYDRVVFRCCLEKDTSGRSLEIPQWMFDRAVCSRMRLATTAVVDLGQLARLRALLHGTNARPNRDPIEDQHRSSNTKGDADAAHKTSASDRTTGTLSTAAETALLADPAGGSSPAGAGRVSPPLSQSSHPFRSSGQQRGGAR
jgi:hypothetical protein